ISKGYSLRSLVLNMLGWCSIGSWLYFGVFGGYTMNLQPTGQLDVVESIKEVGDASTIISVLETSPISYIAILCFVILGFIFLATSLYSASYILASTASVKLGEGIEPNSCHIIVRGQIFRVYLYYLLYI